MSPNSVQAQGPVDGFLYVGIGYCTDASGQFYDSYVKSGVGSNADCGSACLGINSNELVGFEWDSLDNYCNCDFNGGFVTSPFPDGFTDRYYGSGDGEVTSADGAFGYYCFKVIAPTDKPSLQPSAKPSTAVDSFWYVGIGWCLDANGFFYDSYLTLDEGNNADCSNACVGINSNELVGFTWKSSHKQCYCFFNDGFVTSNIPSGFSGYYDDDPGNGEVTFTSQDLGFDCYKLIPLTDKPSLQPSSSSAPTKSAQPSASSVPTSSSAPTESAQPSASSVPSHSSAPSKSAQPSASSVPTSSLAPTKSAQPSASSVPSISPAPSKSAQPSASSVPSISSAPSKSSQPSASLVPSISSAPSKSTQPSASSVPSISLIPSKSAQPTASSAPSKKPSNQPLLNPKSKKSKKR